LSTENKKGRPKKWDGPGES